MILMIFTVYSFYSFSSPDAFSSFFLDFSIQQNLQLTSHLPTTSHGHLLLQLLATRNRSLPRGPGLDSPGDHGKCAVLQINGRRSRCGGWIYANGGIMATRRSSFRSASESRLIRWSFVVCGFCDMNFMMFSKYTSWKIHVIFEGCLHFPTQKTKQTQKMSHSSLAWQLTRCIRWQYSAGTNVQSQFDKGRWCILRYGTLEFCKWRGWWLSGLKGRFQRVGWWKKCVKPLWLGSMSWFVVRGVAIN